jgi:hypothetical protein
MTHILLWFAVGTAYLLSMALICRCMNLGDRKHVKVVPSQINGRRWTDRTFTPPAYSTSEIQG